MLIHESNQHLIGINKNILQIRSMNVRNALFDWCNCSANRTLHCIIQMSPNIFLRKLIAMRCLQKIQSRQNICYCLAFHLNKTNKQLNSASTFLLFSFGSYLTMRTNCISISIKRVSEQNIQYIKCMIVLNSFGFALHAIDYFSFLFNAKWMKWHSWYVSSFQNRKFRSTAQLFRARNIHGMQIIHNNSVPNNDVQLNKMVSLLQ